MQSLSYYVYAYLDPTKKGSYQYCSHSFDFEPFYIGKGKKGLNGRRGRCIRHLSNYCIEHDTNRLKVNKILKIRNDTGNDPIIMIIKDGMSDKDAIALEIALIRNIGRRNMNKGPLSNLTDGGDTSNLSEEARLRISLSRLGKKRDQSVKDKISKSLTGKKATEQQRLKMSLNNCRYWKNKKLSTVTIEKMKKAIKKNGGRNGIMNPNAKWLYSAISPCGEVFNRIENIKMFLIDSNLPITDREVRRISSGKVKKSNSGWVFGREKL